MNSLGGKDEKWRGILMDALFLGMISAFLGLLFANVRDGVPGFIPIVVALVSALLMGVCGILIRVLKWTWLEQYALPLCMLGAMALSIPIDGADGLRGWEREWTSSCLRYEEKQYTLRARLDGAASYDDAGRSTGHLRVLQCVAAADGGAEGPAGRSAHVLDWWALSRC